MSWDFKQLFGKVVRVLNSNPPVNFREYDSFKRQCWSDLVKDLRRDAELISEEEVERGYQFALIWGSSELMKEFERLSLVPVTQGEFLTRELVGRMTRFLDAAHWKSYVGETSLEQNVVVIEAWLIARNGGWGKALAMISALDAGVTRDLPRLLVLRMWEDHFIQTRRPEERTNRRRFLERRIVILGDQRTWLKGISERYGSVVAAQAAHELGDAQMASYFASDVAKTFGVYKLYEAILGMKSTGIEIGEETAVIVFNRLMHHRLYNDAALLANAFGMTNKITEVIKEWHDWASATGNTVMVPDRGGIERAIPRGDGSKIRCTPDLRYPDPSSIIIA